MVKTLRCKKGAALFVVLGTLLIITVLANVALTLIANQSRLTHHQLSRIQAYYAGMAGINLAYQMMFRGDSCWPIPAAGASYSRTICPTCNTGCNVVETQFPHTINSVTVLVQGRNLCNPTPPTGVPSCISSTVDYTAP